MKITVKNLEDRAVFKEVQIREPLMKDVILAERIAGKTDGVEFQLALLSQVAMFDGKKLPPEELQGLPMKDFLYLTTELLGEDIQTLMKELLGQQSIAPAKQEQVSKE